MIQLLLMIWENGKEEWVIGNVLRKKNEKNQKLIQKLLINVIECKHCVVWAKMWRLGDMLSEWGNYSKLVDNCKFSIKKIKKSKKKKNFAMCLVFITDSNTTLFFWNGSMFHQLIIFYHYTLLSFHYQNFNKTSQNWKKKKKCHSPKIKLYRHNSAIPHYQPV